MAVCSNAERVVRMSTLPVLQVRAPQAEGQEAVDLSRAQS
jgi:hypothetical protein